MLSQRPGRDQATMAKKLDDLRDGYDRVSSTYSGKFQNELDSKPFEREVLERFAEHTRGRSQVCDIGCGPGQIGRYPHDRGVDIYGIDFSPRMV